LPAEANGFVTFVSTNNLSKISNSVLETWVKILQEIPSARLIIQSAGTGNQSVKDRLSGLFESGGINADRYDLRGYTSFPEFGKLLDEADIVLDPWPFNGGTTSCHTLYKGLPMISLAGTLHAGRMGMSLLTNVGLPQFIASSKEEYVEIAKRSALDIPALANIRKNLRQNMLNSPLCDYSGYVKRFEEAMRKLWQDHCRENS